jgi:hypothetical protein
MIESTEADNDKRQALTLFAQGDFIAAEILCRRARDAAPFDAKTHYNLGVVLAKLERFEEAARCCQKAIELDPAFAPAYTNLGFCLSALNKVQGAREAFSLGRGLAPENPVPVLNEGIAALALGDYKAGWEGFTARWQLPAYAKFKRDFAKPYWNGENLEGKTIFLYAEQGFGDTIQMARYVPLLAKQGAKVILEAQPALVRLLGCLQGSPQIVSKGDALPDFDYYCAMMDVPRGFGTELMTIPSATPYLWAEPSEVERYRPSLSARRRIGLSWAGRSSHENDHNRSLKFTQLAPWLALQDIEWVSLQRVVPDGDAAALAASSVLDWGRGFADFAVTAAAIMTLDLVITVDTAIAHLAGALGKPVWILLPFYADWRWLLDRTDSPWYPTARLFRQPQPKNWGPTLSSLTKEIAAYPASLS